MAERDTLHEMTITTGSRLTFEEAIDGIVDPDRVIYIDHERHGPSTTWHFAVAGPFVHPFEVQ